MTVSISQVKLDMLRYRLDSLYGRASTYAARLAGLSLHEGEVRVLLDQHRVQEVEQALADLESTLGGFSVDRDPAEKACP